MKKLKILIGTLVLAAGLAGCSSAYYASSGYANDDLYSLHDKTAIARKQQAKAEAEKAAAEARRAEWEARIAEAQAAAAGHEVRVATFQMRELGKAQAMNELPGMSRSTSSVPIVWIKSRAWS